MSGRGLSILHAIHSISRKHITMLKTSEQYEHDLPGSGTLLDHPRLLWGCLGATENTFWITGVSAVKFVPQHLSRASNRHTFLPPHFISNSNKFQDLQYESVNTNVTHSTFFPHSLEKTEKKTQFMVKIINVNVCKTIWKTTFLKLPKIF